MRTGWDLARIERPGMSLLAQSARGLKWQVIEIGGRQLVSLVVFTTLARLLDPGDFGLLGLAGVYLAFVGMFVDQGLSTAVVQRSELEPEHLNAAFWFNMGSGVVACLTTMALAGWIAQVFNEPRLGPVLRWSSLTLVINATAAVHGALFTRGMDFRCTAARTCVANVSGGIVGVGMAIGGYNVWALVGQQLTAALAGACVLWFASTWRPALVVSLPHLRQLMTVGVSVFATGLLWAVASRIDQIVIGRVGGPLVLGQYVVAGKLSELAKTALYQPLGAVSLPALSRLQRNHTRMCEAIYKGMELNALVSVAVFGGLASVAPTLVPVAFGSQWQQAGTLLQFLAVYSMIVGLLAYCYPALLASGGIGRFMAVNTFCTAGAATACLAGIRYGVCGVVVGMIINMVVVGALLLWFLRSRIGLEPGRYCRPCVVPALAGGAMFGAVTVVRTLLAGRTGEWPSVLCQVLVGACVYVGVVLALAPGSIARLRDVAVLALGRRVGQAAPVQ